MRRPNNNSHPQTLSSMGNRPGARSPIGRHDKLVTCAAYSAMHCLDGTLSSNFCPVLQVQNDCESKRGRCARYGPPFFWGATRKARRQVHACILCADVRRCDCLGAPIFKRCTGWCAGENGSAPVGAPTTPHVTPTGIRLALTPFLHCLSI